jgi:antitoxin VapB
MQLNIKDPEAYRLARELADRTGQTLTAAVTESLRDRLAALRRRHDRTRARADVADIQALVASLPDQDPRDPDEILGYDERGLPS